MTFNGILSLPCFSLIECRNTNNRQPTKQRKRVDQRYFPRFSAWPLSNLLNHTLINFLHLIVPFFYWRKTVCDQFYWSFPHSIIFHRTIQHRHGILTDATIGSYKTLRKKRTTIHIRTSLPTACNKSSLLPDETHSEQIQQRKRVGLFPSTNQSSSTA